MAPYFYGKCYKYKRFGAVESAEREHLKNLIQYRKMMFSFPSQFNDPYDCCPVFILGNDPAEDRRRIGDAWEEGRKRAGHRKPNRKELSRHVSKVMQELSTPEGAARHFKPFLDRGTGVFCMSKDWSLLTQWAYYADNGAGLCLEYTVHQDSGFDRVFDVQYTNARPKINIPKALSDNDYRTRAFFDAVTHKALDWSHEQEIRALHTEPGLHMHPEGLLTSVMLGPSASNVDIDWLMHIVGNSTETPVIYRAILSPDTFAMKRQDLS